MEEVAQQWWKVWNEQWIIALVPRPKKWRKNRDNVKVGDIVIFQRGGAKAVLGETPWRIGRVRDRVVGTDGKCREVNLEYCHGDETVFRTTRRSNRSVAVLQTEEDLDLVNSVNDKALDAAIHMAIRTHETTIPDDHVITEYWAFLNNPQDPLFLDSDSVPVLHLDGATLSPSLGESTYEQ